MCGLNIMKLMPGARNVAYYANIMLDAFSCRLCPKLNYVASIQTDYMKEVG